MKHVVQPGPAAPERLQWVEAQGAHLRLRLQPGLPLLEALRSAFAARGFASGVLRLDGLALSSFAYVMPALSKTDEHAAFYSETYRPGGTVRIEHGAMTFGTRDGAPFFHAHAIWTDAEGNGGGHILPDGAVVAQPIEVPALGLSGALFQADHDPETNFKLFGPEPTSPPDIADGSRAFALRMRPNQDITHALEAFCRARGIGRAIIHGGVGSLIGARFDDGRHIEPFATEVAITAGTIVADAAGSSAIEIAMVDYTGALNTGRLAAGHNPVLMTFELVLEATG